MNDRNLYNQTFIIAAFARYHSNQIKSNEIVIAENRATFTIGVYRCNDSLYGFYAGQIWRGHLNKEEKDVMYFNCAIMSAFVQWCAYATCIAFSLLYKHVQMLCNSISVWYTTLLR